ncbi:FAD-dependent oxidoreductase, partial [Acinetobacter baumannii]
RRGATFVHEADIDSIAKAGTGFVLGWADLAADAAASGRGMMKADGVVICAGVASRHFAAMLGERVNVYPVKGYSITVQLDTAASRNAT